MLPSEDTSRVDENQPPALDSTTSESVAMETNESEPPPDHHPNVPRPVPTSDSLSVPSQSFTLATQGCAVKTAVQSLQPSSVDGAQQQQLTAGRHQPGYDIYAGLHNHAGGQFFRMAKRTQLLYPQVDKKVGSVS